jgi:hypothetical protein
MYLETGPDTTNVIGRLDEVGPGRVYAGSTDAGAPSGPGPTEQPQIHPSHPFRA